MKSKFRLLKLLLRRVLRVKQSDMFNELQRCIRKLIPSICIVSKEILIKVFVLERVSSIV